MMKKGIPGLMIMIMVMLTGACSNMIKPEDRALFNSARNGNLSRMKKEIVKSNDLNTVDKKLRTPLMWAVYGGHEDCVRELVLSGAELNMEDVYGYTALDYSIINGHLFISRYLIEKGAEYELEDVIEASGNPDINDFVKPRYYVVPKTGYYMPPIVIFTPKMWK